jgi:exonuclease SbcD
MSQRPFRFLHAADLHLDEPAAGVADVPGHLVDLLVDCPLLAGRCVFDAAVEQHVDFVVLSGDVVDLNRAGPREMAFLVEQFERLAAKSISVYWAGGAIDSADWPVHYILSGNVKQASRLHVQRHRHEIAGEPVCELVGRSHEHQVAPKAHEFANSREDLFSIAVAHTPFAGGMRDLGIEYWALGGLHGRSTLGQSTKSLSHYPGSPQGRSFSEAGAHGCTLVHVDEGRQVRLTPIATDVVRWESQSLTLGVATDRAELESLLRDRTTQLLVEAGGAALVIEWQIVCDGTIFGELRRGKLTGDLLATLQREFGNRTPEAWTVAIRPELPTELPTAWQREETLRGDYLRAIGGMLDESRSSDGNLSPLDLDEILTHAGAGAHLQQFDRLSASLADQAKRRRVLREAAWLGADLLSAEEAAR